jgi:very-short-patch-repair endonuclease
VGSAYPGKATLTISGAGHVAPILVKGIMLSEKAIKDRRRKLLDNRPKEEKDFESIVHKAVWSFKPIVFYPIVRPQQIVEYFGRLFYLDYRVFLSHNGLKKELCFEIDGPYHEQEDVMLRDKYRTAIILDAGYEAVIRFTNDQIVYQKDLVYQKTRASIAKAFNLPFPPEEAVKRIPTTSPRKIKKEAFRKRMLARRLGIRQIEKS